ncbi:hypothetical protein CLOSCI_03735 [[Clostridium] scindens ATCC 35704]|nr:hypothetical protein CLOSCI_03735 [[Clostridium] scindens ATCC 35704]
MEGRCCLPFLCPKMICQNIFPANITTRKFNQGHLIPFYREAIWQFLLILSKK